MLLPHQGYGIFTQFHPFSPLFTHLVLISTTSTPFWVDFSPPWGRREGTGYVAILTHILSVPSLIIKQGF